ncbi:MULTISPECIES: helix-turn-helix domain-containing protein [unclassified Streptomyces]|uniref:helix-turn-helix domain-containing protein n=1 Tax=unclassified Streptomyces TaxID=2593676 RepID=UPI000B0A19A3|nr:helix-turn-helix domain-containing protein [Streptomyces sp. WAC 01420]
MSAQDDVAEFAALLRELKERTDRSYGSLARRLNMNTSTLHRYCAGEAVPVEFAPVERFAALCGASREERLALHARWLQAAATRQHPRAPAPAAGPKSPGVSDLPSAPDRTRARPTAPAPEPRAHSKTTPGSGPRPGTTAAPGRGTHPGKDTAPGTTTTPGKETHPGTDSAPGRGTGTSTRPGSGSEPGTDSPPDPGTGSRTADARGDSTTRPAPDNADSRTGTGTESGHATDNPPGTKADAGGDVTGASTSAPVSGPGRDTRPGAGNSPDPRTGAPSGAGAGGVVSGVEGGPRASAARGGAVSGPLPGGGGKRRPWSQRRKRGAVGVAAACVVLAAVGSLAALPTDDGRRPSAGREGTGVVPSSATAPEDGSATPRGDTASPTPSVTGTQTGSATAAPSPKARPGAPGARRDSAEPSGSKGPAAPLPLTWSADSHVWSAGCGHDYVIARPPKQVPPPPAPQDARTWAEAQSAVHGGETMVELSVQGTSGTAVVLTALRVRVVGRAGPAPGNAYGMDQGCGGALTPRYFDVDLDKDRPIARAVAGNDSGTPIPAVKLPYTVSATDPEVLLVTARTRGCDCRWYLELDWSSQGRTGTVRVDDDGRPFRTSGVADRPRYEYDTSTREWRPRER